MGSGQGLEKGRSRIRPLQRMAIAMPAELVNTGKGVVSLGTIPRKKRGPAVAGVHGNLQKELSRAPSHESPTAASECKENSVLFTEKKEGRRK